MTHAIVVTPPPPSRARQDICGNASETWTYFEFPKTATLRSKQVGKRLQKNGTKHIWNKTRQDLTSPPCCCSFSRFRGSRLQELEGTLGDADVASLDIVSCERPYVEACGAAVRRKSAEHLARGMKALNQTDVGGALQVGGRSARSGVRCRHATEVTCVGGSFSVAAALEF